MVRLRTNRHNKNKPAAGTASTESRLFFVLIPRSIVKMLPANNPFQLHR